MGVTDQKWDRDGDTNQEGTGGSFTRYRQEGLLIEDKQEGSLTGYRHQGVLTEGRQL